MLRAALLAVALLLAAPAAGKAAACPPGARCAKLDLEDLRAALGADKLTLLGVSYGTKVAGEYARRFPQHTAGLVLDSPVSVESLDGTFELRQLAMPRMLRDACAKNPCRRSIPDP